MAVLPVASTPPCCALVAVEGGGRQWRHAAPVRFVRVRAGLEQGLGGAPPVHGHGLEQRGAADQVLVLQVRAPVQQPGHHLCFAPMGGQQEAGIAAAVPGLQGRAEADEAFDQAEAAAFAGVEEKLVDHAAVQAGLFDGETLLDLLADQGLAAVELRQLHRLPGEGRDGADKGCGGKEIRPRDHAKPASRWCRNSETRYSGILTSISMPEYQAARFSMSSSLKSLAISDMISWVRVPERNALS
jgi:hypothetical protein